MLSLILKIDKSKYFERIWSPIRRWIRQDDAPKLTLEPFKMNKSEGYHISLSCTLHNSIPTKDFFVQKWAFYQSRLLVVRLPKRKTKNYDHNILIEKYTSRKRILLSHDAHLMHALDVSGFLLFSFKVDKMSVFFLLNYCLKFRTLVHRIQSNNRDLVS